MFTTFQNLEMTGTELDLQNLEDNNLIS